MSGFHGDADDLEAAANAGDTDAMLKLGIRAHNAGDIGLAKSWFTKAANLDHPQAMDNLGIIAKQAEDLGLAKSWFTKAANGHGNPFLIIVYNKFKLP